MTGELAAITASEISVLTFYFRGFNLEGRINVCVICKYVQTNERI